MEITSREIIVSISLILVLLIIGGFISGAINNAVIDANEKYLKAVRVLTNDVFEYGMSTNVGYAFVEGTLRTDQPVTYDEIEGEYMYVYKTREEYRRHTRQVAHHKTDSKGRTTTYYTTEVYHSWDVIRRESKTTPKIIFLDHEFQPHKIQLPYGHHIDTQYHGARVRYIYSGADTSYDGVIFTQLANNTITDGSRFYVNKTIDEAKEIEISSGTGWQVLFWTLWIIGIGFLVYWFCYYDNSWLY